MTSKEVLVDTTEDTRSLPISSRLVTWANRVAIVGVAIFAVALAVGVVVLVVFVLSYLITWVLLFPFAVVTYEARWLHDTYDLPWLFMKAAIGLGVFVQLSCFWAAYRCSTTPWGRLKREKIVRRVRDTWFYRWLESFMGASS